jgi:hypothetical protein
MVLWCLRREAAGAGWAPASVVCGGGGAMGALSWAANPSRVLAACNLRAGGNSSRSRTWPTPRHLWEVAVVRRSPEFAALGIADALGVQDLVVFPSRGLAVQVLRMVDPLRVCLMHPFWCARSTAARAMPVPQFGVIDAGGALGGRCWTTSACRVPVG